MAKNRPLPPGVPPDGPGAPAATPGTKPPPHGTPRPLSEQDVAGDLPRVCGQLDRVPAGSRARRYKCQVQNVDGFRKVQYILAASKDDAKALHLRAVGLEAHLAELREQGAKEHEVVKPMVAVTELAD